MSSVAVHTPPAAAVTRSSSSSSSSRPASPLQHAALFALFLFALLLMYLLFRNFPSVSPEDKELLRFPRAMADVRVLSRVLRKYRDENMGVVVAGFAAIYIFLQAFAIPGALFLSILAGPLFGVWRGLLLVSLVATSGSCLCFTLCNFLGRGVVERCFPAMLLRLRGMVARRTGSDLFFYLLFLRISPLLPNWFISLSSPLLNIPLPTFAAATFIGLMPANYLHVTTGIALEELDSGAGDEAQGGGGGSALNWRALAFLFAIAFVALIPTLLKSKFEAWSGAGAQGGAAVDTEGAEEMTDAVNQVPSEMHLTVPMGQPVYRRASPPAVEWMGSGSANSTPRAYGSAASSPRLPGDVTISHMDGSIGPVAQSTRSHKKKKDGKAL